MYGKSMRIDPLHAKYEQYMVYTAAELNAMQPIMRQRKPDSRHVASPATTLLF